MEAPLELEVTLGHPAAPAGQEPNEPVYARLRVRPRPGVSGRPRLDFWFVLDASASMHRFVLEPQQREHWRRRAEERGEVSRQEADGRTGMVWSGVTLRELQRHVSTPMLSALRGVWRTMQTLQPQDNVGVLAFADQFAAVYEDAGVGSLPQRLEAAKEALARIGSGVDESGLGRGTRLAEALRHAVDRLSPADGAPVLRRMVLVSDGVIEDVAACRALLDTAVDRGLVISVIGVGEDFDEEFLMEIADVTRGNYYYCPTAIEVENAVTAELEIVTSVVGRQATLRVFPQNGTILRDVYPVAPAMSEFQTMWLENGTWRFRIGDLSAAQESEFLIELAPAIYPAGELPIASVRVEGLGATTADGFGVEAPVNLFYSSDRMLLQARDDEVLDLVRRLDVYLEERRAALADASGDTEGATKHLQAATRMLRTMGAEELAEDMEAAAEESESGTKNLARTKRVKAGTRRLGTR